MHVKPLVPLYDQVRWPALSSSANDLVIDRLLVRPAHPAGISCWRAAPDSAKTLAVRTLARTLHLTFKRIQFTPDLLPADVIGTQIHNLAPVNLPSNAARSLLISFWPTKSIARQPRFNPRYSKRCKNGK
jgi:hypothetical protein